MQNIMVDKMFFYPNACYVCKRWGVKLISCLKCKMIFYCNRKHRQEHLPQHEEICAAIKHALKDKEYMNTEDISMAEWIKIRTEYHDKVSGILERDLTAAESDMFLYPKACVVCHRQDTDVRCIRCPSAAFCDKHIYSEHRNHLRKHCKLMRDCFVIENRLPIQIDMYYLKRVSDKRPFYDMNSFLDTYLLLDKNNVYSRMLHSYKVTDPLTVYFCIQKLDYLRCKTLNIHIIMGTHFISREDINIWMMLFTLIPDLTTLTITFIQQRNVCFNACGRLMKVANGPETKELDVYIHNMLYEEYVSSADFTKPNFIVGFDAHFANDSYVPDEYVDLSERSARALAERKCPCILVFKYIFPYKEEFLNKVEKHFFGKNPFMNLIPYRHMARYIYYSNEYLIIFKDLDSSKVVINKDNQCFLFSKSALE